MAFNGESLGVSLRVGPARCTNRCNNKLITRRYNLTTQDKQPAWRPFERRRFILWFQSFISNAHLNTKTTSSFPTTINQHKILHNAIQKQNIYHHHHRASHHKSTSRLLSCLDSPPPADVDAVQAAKINSDLPLDGAAEVDRDHLLCIQSIHNPLSHIVSQPSDHDETCGTDVLPLFEASMLSTPRRSQPSSKPPLHPHTKSSSATPISTPQAMISQSIARTSPARRTSPTLIAADGSSPHVSFDIHTPTQKSDPRQCGRIPTTTAIQAAEMNNLADRFSALYISTPTIENRVANRINEGKWPWAARSTSTDFDVSTKRYEANLLMLLHDFVLKARHQYVLTKKWPAEEIERSALALADKARKAWAQGTREETDDDEEEEGERNHLEELDWYWRYWGKRCRAEQKVWGYVVGGSAGRYYAGATCVGAQQTESQRGVDF